MSAIGLVAAGAAALLAIPGGLAPGATPASNETCTWKMSTVRLYQELTPLRDDRSVQLRELLAASGVGDTDFLPAACKSGPTGRDTSGTSNGNGGSGDGAGGGSSGGTSDPTGSASGNDSSGSGGAASGSGEAGTGSAGASGGTSAGTSSAGAGESKCANTAAKALNWGTPNRADEFESADSAKNWGIYDGEGHAGNGRRSPDQVAIADGLLTLTGDEQGNSAGMAWNPGQKYGRWEGCVQSPAGADSLHSLMLLWPDAENWPEGGEVDFMEISDPDRQSVDSFLHYSASNDQEAASVDVDATQWHAWAVEWTPAGITQYVDGKEWWKTTDQSHLPPGPMHLCIQLDYFGGDAGSGAKEHVDWVRQYSGEGGSSGTAGADSSSGESATGSGSGASGGDSGSNGSSGDKPGNGSGDDSTDS